jgi:hypothetical protein
MWSILVVLRRLNAPASISVQPTSNYVKMMYKRSVKGVYEPALFVHVVGSEPEKLLLPNGNGFDQDAPKSLRPAREIN